MKLPTRPVILAAIAASLLALGGMLGYASAQWSVESQWTLHVSAPQNHQWTLRFPQPEPPMEVELIGTVSVGTVEVTSHGILGNATGVGNATIRYVLRELLFVPGADPWRVGTVVGPSGGRDSQGFWLWRQSADPSAPIHVFGGGGWEAYRLLDHYYGGLFGYQGNLQEGWSVLRPLAGDAVAMIGDPSASELSIAFLVAGTAVAVLAIAGRRFWPVRTFG